MNRKNEFIFVTVLVLAIAITFAWATAAVLFPLPQDIKVPAGSGELKAFTSYADMVSFLEKSNELQQYNSRTMYDGLMMKAEVATAAPTAQGAMDESNSAGASDHSTTNIQVEGVDEADFIKNDGKYIYIIPQSNYGSGRKVLIINAYPAGNAKIISEILLDGTPSQLYVNGDKLIVFGQRSMPSYYPPVYRTMAGGAEAGVAVADIAVAKVSSSYMPYMPYYSYEPETFIEVYDISDRSNPELARNLSFTGSYYDSRMIGDYVYAIVNAPAQFYRDDGFIPMPAITENGKTENISATSVYYFDIPDYSYNFLNILSVNVNDDHEDFNIKTFLAGYSNEMFVSQDNIYLTNTKWRDWYWYRNANASEQDTTEKTVVNKIAIANGDITYMGKATVPGTVLNQFSMDESNGYFRIATTASKPIPGEHYETITTNNIYVLDSGLSIVGRLEDLAPGESIYSARFMGERAYLVTFKQVDPLFVIDLSDPTAPEVLGKLKIPGYSNYLHPYDATHLIGIGKDVDESIDADKVHSANAVYYTAILGVKLSLFDVSDVEHPKEISKYIIGGRGSDSEALNDHKALLFDKEKNLLVLPILETEKGNTSEDYYGNNYVFQGAYVMNVDLENGFTLKGKVSHVEDDSAFKKAGDYYYDWYGNNVRRSLYMGNTLYTVSNNMIKMNDLNDMSDLGKINISQPYEQGYPYPVLY
jgi:inhibitor of cysteine peptidase